jgi:hypothetical protein
VCIFWMFSVSYAVLASVRTTYYRLIRRENLNYINYASQ